MVNNEQLWKCNVKPAPFYANFKNCEFFVCLKAGWWVIFLKQSILGWSQSRVDTPMKCPAVNGVLLWHVSPRSCTVPYDVQGDTWGRGHYNDFLPKLGKRRVGSGESSTWLTPLLSSYPDKSSLGGGIDFSSHSHHGGESGWQEGRWTGHTPSMVSGLWGLASFTPFSRDPHPENGTVHY